MKQCPKCNASVSDTAKFCIKCGFNIKKHEEENAEFFCPECGNKVKGGNFCPECGFDIKKEVNKSNGKEISFDDFGLDDEKPKKKSKKKEISFDDFGLDLDETSQKLDNKIIEKESETLYKAFEYTKYGKNQYIITKYIDSFETNVIIPKNTIGIADGAFEGTYVTSVKLNQGLKTIGKRAFANCAYLTDIKIPLSVNRIDDEAFYGCVRLNIGIPDSVIIRGNNITGNTNIYPSTVVKVIEAQELNSLGFKDVYIGEVGPNGKPNGFGTYIWATNKEKYTYTGQFVDFKLQGFGVLVFPDGYTQFGRFEDARLEGYAVDINIKYDYATFAYFENGDYDEEIDGLYDYGYSAFGDVQLGFTSFNENNGTYIGHIYNNMKNHIGQYTYVTGEVFIGQFIDNEATGTGICIFPDGSYYVGSMKQYKYDGYGIFVKADGTYKYGFWTRGILNER